MSPTSPDGRRVFQSLQYLRIVQSPHNSRPAIVLTASRWSLVPVRHIRSDPVSSSMIALTRCPWGSGRDPLPATSSQEKISRSLLRQCPRQTSRCAPQNRASMRFSRMLKVYSLSQIVERESTPACAIATGFPNCAVSQIETTKMASICYPAGAENPSGVFK